MSITLNQRTIAKPFLKWAGGKTQLLNQMEKFIPLELKHGIIQRYVEPFIGGGALFFHIALTYDLEEYIISDLNEELILSYKTIQKSVNELIDSLTRLEKTYFKMPPEKQKLFFYKTRELFNKNKAKIDYNKFSMNWVERTAQLIFLNRTCFNGLFRVNSQGFFNVPFGSYKNPTICSKHVLLAISGVLQKAIILHGDFTVSDKYINSNTFVYFDPPYRPISETSSFTSYSKGDFNDQEQDRLAEYFRKLDKKSAQLMLSNSDPKNENINDNFFDKAYNGFRIERVQASRMINCNAERRGKIAELLVMNY
jgi:DNA adenine methylase